MQTDELLLLRGKYRAKHAVRTDFSFAGFAMVSISPQARPGARINIIAQHPENRPHTLPIRAFDPRLKASICLGKFAFGFQARRGKRPAHIAQAHLAVLILSSHDQLPKGEHDYA